MIKQVEQKMGRIPTFRYGPRVIDIDILLFDDIVFTTQELTIPHPEMKNRAFVLAPLVEIDPLVINSGRKGNGERAIGKDRDDRRQENSGVGWETFRNSTGVKEPTSWGSSMSRLTVFRETA